MRKIFAVSLTAVVLVVALVQWHEYRATMVKPVSSSQFFIHGTPVCVFRDGEDIVARVGECGAPMAPPESDSMESLPFRHGHPGMKLPPGHPPIDQGIPPEGERRLLI